MWARGSNMDDNYDFKAKPGPRLSESVMDSISTRSVPTPVEPVQDVTETEQQPAASNQVSRKPKAPLSTAGDFTGPMAPCQLKIPTDLIQSLKLHSISTGKTMSELVFECVTSPEMLGKAWISTRKAG